MVRNSRLFERQAGLVVAVLLMAAHAAAVAQTVVMPTVGHGDTTMSYAIVYDDGGASGPYSEQCNASYTFHTVSPNGRYIIDVESFLIHPQGNAMLQIFNNASANGSLVCTYPSGSGGRYISTTSNVTISFSSDDDMPTDGFKVVLCEFTNVVATNVATGFLDSNTIYIQWGGGSASTVWTLQYAIVADAVDENVFFDDTANFYEVQLHDTYFTIPDVPVGMHVVFRILTPQGDAPCALNTTGQGAPYQEHEECPCVKPASVTVDSIGDSLLISWSYPESVSNWHLWYPMQNLDTVLPGSVMQFTIPYDFPCFGDFLWINGDCNRACNQETVYLPTGGCHLSVGSLRRKSNDGHSITLQWNALEDSAARLLLSYRRADQYDYIFIDTLMPWTSEYTVNGLQPVTAYSFQIQIICSDGSFSCTPSSVTIQTTLDNCIDYVNFNDTENVHRTWGVYSDPMRNSMGAAGRHTPIVDTTLTDVRTGGALRCVPRGELASIRLGDDNIGAQAETITFDYQVDSLDKDMLVLKYAVVLQNANHNSVNQPHFTLEILDQNGQVVDTSCCYADFYAAGDLGWNSVAGTNIIWKDWTTVGIDIARYHNQRIKIRFTTKDCSDGGHFGYAYFTIGCDSKRIALVNLCETIDSVRLRVPLGFEYRWTHGDDTTLISTNNEILVPADSTVYHCHASFVGRPECSFDVQSLAVLPRPRADFQLHFDTCNNRAVLISHCRVDIDSSLLPFVRQTIDSIRWEVDGQTFYGDTARITFHGNGDYPVRLFCRLSDSHCMDSLDTQVSVDFWHSGVILGDTVACVGDSITLNGIVRPYNEVAVAWENGLRDTVRDVVVASDTLFTLFVSYLNCYDTLTHHIAVKPHYDDTVAASFCRGDCDTLGFNEVESGLYTHRFGSVFGCDSLITLSLTIFPTYGDTVVAVSCNEPYSDVEFSVDTSGFYVHAYQTVHGCDSIHALSFFRHLPFVDTVADEIYFGDVFDDFGFVEQTAGFYTHAYTDRYGCDSTWNLDLRVVHLRFPNVVTPNGDGYNDILEIVGLLDATMFDYNCILIYDRWGRRIYKKENISQSSDFWNPNSGADIPDGTYFYRFVARGKKRDVEYKGVVEVIRN